MTRETARFKDLLVKFLASLDFQNQEDRGRRNQLLLKQKQLNDFEKECISHGQVLATELLKENLQVQSIAQAKIIEAFEDENEVFTTTINEL